MNSTWSLMFWLGVNLCAQAQQPAATGFAGSLVERERIAAQRTREHLRYEQEEAACYQRFVVNDCLREVRVRRRATFEELRRQEIILNDVDRKRAAAEQLRISDEKAAAQKGQEAAAQRQAERQSYEEKRERARQKKDNPSRRVPEQANPPQASASGPHADTLSSRAAERKAYEEKLSKAQERKAQRDKDLAEKSGRSAHPLPVNP